MGKGYRRRMKQNPPEKGPCFTEGCTANGGTIFHCTTCEALEKAGKLEGPVFRVQACQDHYQDGQKKIRRHALTAHPANILRVVAAGLKGEEI